MAYRKAVHFFNFPKEVFLSCDSFEDLANVLLMLLFILASALSYAITSSQECYLNRNKQIYQLDRLKNPNWWKADQLALYKHDVGVGIWFRETWSRDLWKVPCPNHSAALSPPNKEGDCPLTHHTEAIERMLEAGECAENEAKNKAWHWKECECFYSEQTRNHSLIIAVHYCRRNLVNRKNRKFDS